MACRLKRARPRCRPPDRLGARRVARHRTSAPASASAHRPPARACPVLPSATRSALPPTRGGHHGQPAGHGFEDGIRDAFGQRRQHEAIQAPHDIRHIGALAGQPGQVGSAGLLQDGLALGAQAGPSPTITRRRRSRSGGASCQRLHEGRASSGWSFTVCMRPTVPTSHSRGSLKGAARMAAARARAPGEAPAVHAVVDLRDARGGCRPCCR
jgi:hypothetical protein